MSKPKIIANCLVKNEEKWIWYALMSVIDYVDEILVWDTGSTDNTVEIIKSIPDPKIKFTRFNSVNSEQFTDLRQQMLEKSAGFDWLLILDGDEIWPKNAIEDTVSAMSPDKEFIVNHYKNLLGDVYHYQEEKAGKYQIGNYSGHITIRAVNLKKISGLHFALPYGKEGLFDSANISIQNRTPQNTSFVSVPYLHTTFLDRSRHDFEIPRRRRLPREMGKQIPNDYNYPPCFYLPHPDIIPSPWIRISFFNFIKSVIVTPAIILKRLIYG